MEALEIFIADIRFRLMPLDALGWLDLVLVTAVLPKHSAQPNNPLSLHNSHPQQSTQNSELATNNGRFPQTSRPTKQPTQFTQQPFPTANSEQW